MAIPQPDSTSPPPPPVNQDLKILNHRRQMVRGRGNVLQFLWKFRIILINSVENCGHFQYFHFNVPWVTLMHSLSSPGRLPLFLREFFGMVLKLVLYRGVTVSLLVLPLLLLCMQQNSSQHSVSVPGSAQHLYFKPEGEHSTKPKCCKECYQTCMLPSIIRSDGSFNTHTQKRGNNVAA